MISKLNCTTSTDFTLHARIRVLIYQVGLEEKELLQVLQIEGFQVQARTLKYIWHGLGIFRRASNSIAAQAQVEEVLSTLQQELESGQIEEYGRKVLHQHVRSQGFMISR